MRLTLITAACGLAFVTPVLAETATDYLLDDIVVTATRFEQPLFNTLQHTTLITTSEIQASQASDVPTLLRQYASIEITQDGGIGKRSSVFLRGTESDHTLILLDGIRIGSASTGMTALDQIMLDDIERIEIVRGNVSSVYGSEAIGGVIQIFTKKGKGSPHSSVRAGLGSYGSRLIAADNSGKTGATRYFLGVTHRDSEGFSVARREFVPTPSVFSSGDNDKDGYRNTTLTFNLTHTLDAGDEIGLNTRYSRGRVEYDGTSDNQSEQDVGHLALFSRHRLSDAWQGLLTLAESTDTSHSFLDGQPKDRLRTSNRQLEWFNTFTLTANQTATVGLTHLEQHLSSNRIYSRDTRTVQSLTAGYLGEFGTHTVQINTRHDDYSDFGGHETGLLGYGYAITPQWKAVASLSTAFRAPSFNNLYNAGWGGNPDLKPEKARSRELGLQYGKNGVNAKLVHFETKIEDLIDWSKSERKIQNVERATIDGWETSLTGKFGEYSLRASLTLQQPVNETTGQALLRRAKRFGTLAISRDFDKLSLTLETKASSARPDIHVATYAPVKNPGYTVWNLSGSYRLGTQARLDVRLDNLFDKDYALVHGYNTAGRSFQANLNWTF